MQFNNMFDQNPQIQKQMLEFRKQFVTRPSLKWGIILGFGFLPMVILWTLFGGTDSNTIFNSNNGEPNFVISYGYQWLLAILATTISFITGIFFVRFNKEVKGDIYGNLLALNFVVINFWLFNIGGWTWLTVIPMYLFGYIIATILRVVLFVLKARLDLTKIRNGDLSSITKNMTEEEQINLKIRFEQLSRINPNFKNPFENNSTNTSNASSKPIEKDELEFDKENKDDVIDVKEKKD